MRRSRLIILVSCLILVSLLMCALFWPRPVSTEEITKRGHLPRFKMPGQSFQGQLPGATEQEDDLAAMLRRDVIKLADDIGERNVYNYAKLVEATAYLEAELTAAGYAVQRQTYRVRGRECSNVVAELRGSEEADEVIVVGGHFDSAPGTPGANDNASGTAATLALARMFANTRPSRTIRFVLFVSEEPPWFQSEAMGSVVYARACHERREKIVAMYSLETIGYFSDQPGSQHYPPLFRLFYPSTGNFIGFVGNTQSGPLVAWTTSAFRQHATFPSEGAALPERIPGVGWSDHWSFWQFGYSAVMVTDTAPFRYPHYHLASDTADKLEYERMARVVAGLHKVLVQLASRHDVLAEPVPPENEGQIAGDTDEL